MSQERPRELEEVVANQRCKWGSCNAVLATFDALHGHLLDSHIGCLRQNNLARECMWEGCKATPRDRGNFTSHILVHLPGHRPYKCPQCPLKFRRPRDRIQHERESHPQRGASFREVTRMLASSTAKAGLPEESAIESGPQGQNAGEERPVVDRRAEEQRVEPSTYLSRSILPQPPRPQPSAHPSGHPSELTQALALLPFAQLFPPAPFQAALQHPLTPFTLASTQPSSVGPPPTTLVMSDEFQNSSPAEASPPVLMPGGTQHFDEYMSTMYDDDLGEYPDLVFETDSQLPTRLRCNGGGGGKRQLFV